MYDKLCRQLRAMANTWGITLPREAADTIEELSAKYQKALSDLVKQAESPKEDE